MQSKRTNSKMPRSKARPKLIFRRPVKGIAHSALIRRMAMSMTMTKEDLARLYFWKIEKLFPGTTALLKEIVGEIPETSLPIFVENAFPGLRDLITQRLQGTDNGGPNA